MNKTLLLAKVLLKNGSGNVFRRKKKSGKIPKNILYVILLALAFVPIISMISAVVAFLYDSFAVIGQEGIILGIGLAVVSLVIFLFGIFYVINVFYFSQDIEHLLPLPLKPSQILSAKFIVTLVFEYITELFMLAPILVTFGIKSGAGFMYYVYSLLIFVTLPILPLVISSVIAMLIMRFTNIAKNKDRFRMIGGIAAVAFGFGVNFYFQRFNNNQVDPSQLESLLSTNNSLVNIFTNMFPSTKLGTIALLEADSLRGIAGIAGFLGISVLIYLVFSWLGEKLYFKGVMGISESSAKRQQLSSEQLDKHSSPSSSLFAFLVKELRILFRTPVFFLNCVLMCFLWPIIVMIPLFTQLDRLDILRKMSSEMFQDPSVTGIVLGVAFGVFLFLSGSNSTAATSISREGTGIFILKYLPVPYSKMLFAKVLSGSLLSMISVVLMLGVAIFVVHLPVAFCLLLLVLSLPAVLFANFTGLLIDVQFPKLHWDNEQKAVKQNFNGVLSMLLNIIVAGIIVFCAIFFELDMITMFFVLFILFTLLNLLFYRLFKARGAKWMGKIEI